MKKILIIGGNSGIGEALATSLMANGDEVHLALRSVDELSPQLIGNVASVQSFQAEEECALDLPDSLDGVVYCPGTINLKPFHRFTLSEMKKDMDVNVFGAVGVIQKALPSLKKSGRASVVLFSSVAAQTGLAMHGSISLSKGAVEGLTVALAAELAPAKIRVNAVAPSLTDTPLAEFIVGSDTRKAAASDRHPLKCIGTAKGAAKLVEYLLSDDSAFITGQVMKVDGGLSSLR